jgi:Xaa-Pro dipeptidase
MTIGVGGSTPETELAKLKNMTADIQPITREEYQARIAKAQGLMKAEGLDAIYINAGTNLYYFTGTRWHASERMVGAVIPADGGIVYIAPHFEISTLEDFMFIKGEVRGWQEHESPYLLFGEALKALGIDSGKIGLDESSSFFIFDGLRQAAPAYEYVNAKPVTAGCRMCKSDAEIALLQRAKHMTIEVHKAAGRILKAGMMTTEVAAFINEAHKAVGARGSSFVIVLFGEATAYPHGVKEPQCLREGDMVLIDTGCLLEGYNSDITRTYVFGEPTERQRFVWDAEKAAQAAAFDAAQIGVRCGDADLAARKVIDANGFGPDYSVPGLPHRTGHGIGLDIHEWPYLVKSDDTPLAKGMCFSNEPMICVYGEFGVRLEDHFYMADAGPKWFTEPSTSIDDPFNLGHV